MTPEDGCDTFRERFPKSFSDHGGGQIEGHVIPAGNPDGPQPPGRRTEGSGSGLWPTPATRDYKDSTEHTGKGTPRQTRRKQNGHFFWI